MIAHRPAAVEFADELIVLKEGRVACAGRRADVVAGTEFKSVFR